MTGKAIDDHAARIRVTIKQIKAIVTRLERQGVLHAFAHFKPGGRMMFLKEPTDASSGKRRYHYIGVDPGKQKEALDKIERYHRSQKAKQEVLDLSRRLGVLGQDLSHLKEQYADLEKWARRSAKAAATRKQAPSRARRRKGYGSARLQASGGNPSRGVPDPQPGRARR